MTRASLASDTPRPAPGASGAVAALLFCAVLQLAAATPAAANAPAEPVDRAAAAPRPESALVQPGPTLPPGAAVGLPGEAQLEYATTASGRWLGIPLTLHGSTVIAWRLAAGRYEAGLDIERIDFHLASSGRLRADRGLAPERYTERRMRRSPASIAIDGDPGRIRFGEGEAAHPAPFGIQDPLSWQFQLSVLRQAFPERFAVGAVVPMPMAGAHDVTQWNFQVLAEETVGTRLGAMPALHIRSQRRTGEVEESAEVWLSAALGWLPARIRIVDRNGVVIDSVLDRARIDGVQRAALTPP